MTYVRQLSYGFRFMLQKLNKGGKLPPFRDSLSTQLHEPSAGEALLVPGEPGELGRVERLRYFFTM